MNVIPRITQEKGCIIFFYTVQIPSSLPFLVDPSHICFVALLLQTHQFLPTEQRVDTPLIGRNIPYEAKWV